MSLDDLSQRYLDGEATESEVAALEELLRHDAAARRQFAELANLDSALAEQAAYWVAPASKPSHRPPAKNRRPARQWLAAAAALALLVTGAGWWQSYQQGYATVAKGIGTSQFTEGGKVRNTAYELNEGTVEFLTARGARVVIEAPAHFQFESAQRLRMTQGRLAADVPPSAKGFTVITPTGKAVDLGTKFGVDVPPQGQAEIHVFQGEVIAQSSEGGRKQSLRDGEAYTLESGAGSTRELRSAAFIRPEETSSLQAAFTAGQHSRSDAAKAALRNDPALITLLDFEDVRRKPEGTYRMVQGRWPGSLAPEFVNIGDHMKLNVGGHQAWPQLTLAAWVRLDRLGAPYQSLYHTDGWDEDKPGQVHWMIHRDSTMRLALKHNVVAQAQSGPQTFPDSRTPVLPEQGRWVHLAVVYDAPAGTARFFLNGKFDNETVLTTAHPALLGPAQLGNWNANDRKLSGRVDELFLLGRAMTDAEIHAVFDAGNPYR